MASSGLSFAEVQEGLIVSREASFFPRSCNLDKYCNYGNFIRSRHSVTIAVTDLTSPDILTNVFSTLRGPSVNRKDLQALTLMGPTRNNLVLDPLAVPHLDNRLYMCIVVLTVVSGILFVHFPTVKCVVKVKAFYVMTS